MAPTKTPQPVRDFCIQLGGEKGGGWPAVMRVRADTIAETPLDNAIKARLVLAGVDVAVVRAPVAAWWIEDEEPGAA